MRTAVWTSLALTAFAMNSVLCRLALGGAAIDAASFSTVRLGSGAAMLLLITSITGRAASLSARSNWVTPALLFVYAAAFSFAYINLSASTGALLLFASVQATMIVVGIRSGERPDRATWAGLSLALAGLVYLVVPGLTAPSPIRSGLMMVAGVAWGIYSVKGRGVADPLVITTNNFVRALPFAVIVNIVLWPKASISAWGLLLAVLSGAIASGIGYVIWYAALRGLTATRAATVQLVVPVLASAGGVVLLSETVTSRLVLSAALVLGGIGLTLAGRERTLRAGGP